MSGRRPYPAPEGLQAMPKTQSINQNPLPDALPDFRSTGVLLRSLLLANAVAMLAALGVAISLQDVVARMMGIFALLEPVLLASLLLLFALNSWLARLSYRRGVLAVVALTGWLTLIIYRLGGELYLPQIGSAGFHTWRVTLLGCAGAALLLAYFKLRALALSPALHEARLQALQARIRPHFLFNTINAVLGIVRADPKRAETALEDMSDLFRMAMGQSRDLVPARHEVGLARQYLALEQLRLGERLQVKWHTEDLPDDALLLPLMLQPLLENAVYHGVEPMIEGGLIDVRLYRKGKELHLEMYNPCHAHGTHHAGNAMALNNIRERLSLKFDIEASYMVETGKDFYRVHIILPYVSENNT